MNRFESFYKNKTEPKFTHPVLDVGSGSRPFPPADTICDAFVQPTIHRVSALKTDGKPFVLCVVEYLPFRDKAFAFAHCAHVIEHLESPAKAIAELRRVANHGYVETPGWLGESILFGNEAHLWVVYNRGSRPAFKRNRKHRQLGFVELYRYSYPFRIIVAMLDLMFPGLVMMRWTF